jgi:hypothetical protein
MFERKPIFHAAAFVESYCRLFLLRNKRSCILNGFISEIIVLSEGISARFHLSNLFKLVLMKSCGCSCAIKLWRPVFLRYKPQKERFI